jgi:hypothetical protein
MLYVQQWAWLSTRAKDQTKSRMEVLDDDEIADRFPEIGSFDYIIETLVKAGVALNDGNGVHGLTWVEINAFLCTTRMHLTAWEAETIKRLSALYASSVLKYDNIDAQAPYRTQEEQDRIAKTMKSVLSGIVIKDKHGSSNHSDKSRHAASNSG